MRHKRDPLKEAGLKHLDRNPRASQVVVAEPSPPWALAQAPTEMCPSYATIQHTFDARELAVYAYEQLVSARERNERLEKLLYTLDSAAQTWVDSRTLDRDRIARTIHALYDYMREDRDD